MEAVGAEYGVSDLIVNARSIENPSVSATDPSAWQTIFGNESSVAGVDITFESVMGFPPIFRAVNLISAKCGGTPLEVIERESTVVIEDHPCFKLFGKNQAANGYTNSLQMSKALTLHAQIYGGGFAAIIREMGVPVSLRLLDPLSICPAIIDGPNGPDDPRGRELWWGTWIDGEMIPIPDDDMFHIPSLTLKNGVQGLSMLELMRNALGLPLAAQEYSARFFSNGSNLSGVLMVPGHFREDKIRNTMKAWESMQTGLTKAHKIALLQDGVKWLPTAADPEKSQLNETRDHELRATVSNITGVPPHLLGDSTRTSHNSLESENASLLDYCLRPWFDVWEAETNRKLRTPAERQSNSVTVEFNIRDFLRMDFKGRVDGYKTLKEIGVLTTNDILSAENMPTIGEEGDKRYVPANWTEAGEEPEPAQRDAAEAETEVEAMVRRIVSARAQTSLEVEARQVVKAAGTEANFVSWLESFYTSWPERSADTLQEVGKVSGSVFAEHADASKQALLEVAGSCTASTLVESVKACVSEWPSRLDRLTSAIVKELKTN